MKNAPMQRLPPEAIMSWSRKFFQRCSRCRRVPPGGPCQQLLPTQRGATENLGKNREPCCRDNEKCEIVGTYVCKVVSASGNSLGARNSELDPRLAGFPLTMAFCCFYSAATFRNTLASCIQSSLALTLVSAGTIPGTNALLFAIFPLGPNECCWDPTWHVVVSHPFINCTWARARELHVCDITWLYGYTVWRKSKHPHLPHLESMGGNCFKPDCCARQCLHLASI